MPACTASARGDMTQPWSHNIQPPDENRDFGAVNKSSTEMVNNRRVAAHPPFKGCEH